jgi:DUF2075 family protein
MDEERGIFGSIFVEGGSFPLKNIPLIYEYQGNICDWFGLIWGNGVRFTSSGGGD